MRSQHQVHHGTICPPRALWASSLKPHPAVAGHLAEGRGRDHVRASDGALRRAAKAEAAAAGAGAPRAAPAEAAGAVAAVPG